MIMGIGASALVNSRLKKYSNVFSSLSLTGEEMAYKMLSDNGVGGVRILKGRQGQDHFDPRDNTISLSPDVFDKRSVTAVATACHEVGHAIQYAQKYAPMQIRGSIVPVANIASNAWPFLLMLGILMHISGMTTLACVMYAFVVLFELVTLPVEFNASSRALQYMNSLSISTGEIDGAKKVLSSCALTYVVAALTSILQFLWLLFEASND